eukprot:15461145-Alexandrium_andersonii.AAC.1
MHNRLRRSKRELRGSRHGLKTDTPKLPMGCTLRGFSLRSRICLRKRAGGRAGGASRGGLEPPGTAQ